MKRARITLSGKLYGLTAEIISHLIHDPARRSDLWGGGYSKVRIPSGDIVTVPNAFLQEVSI